MAVVADKQAFFRFVQEPKTHTAELTRKRDLFRRGLKIAKSPQVRAELKYLITTLDEELVARLEWEQIVQEGQSSQR